MIPTHEAAGKVVQRPRKAVVPVLPITYPQGPSSKAVEHANQGTAQVPVLPPTTTKQQKHAHEARQLSESTMHASPTVVPEAMTPSVSATNAAKADAGASAASLQHGGALGRNGTVTPTLRPAPLHPSVASPTPTPPPPNNALYDSATRGALQSPSAPGSDGAAVVPQFGPVRSRVHQAQPSNGSLMFGGFGGSNASSPVPRSSSGFPRPNSMPYHAGPASVAAANGFGRPPAGLTYTPQSLHGSQSSNQVEDTGFAHHPAIPGMNGNPVFNMDSARQQSYPGPGAAPLHPSAAFSAHGPGPNANLFNFQIREQILQHSRDCFYDYESSDCSIELRLPDQSPWAPQQLGGPPTPLKLDLHQFVMLQSPLLRQVLRSRAPSDRRNIVLEPHDDLTRDFMRPDAFFYTFRTLYGWDLGDNTIMIHCRPVRDSHDAFDLALGYAAAARYLQLPSVHTFALEHATRLVGWDTLEKACRFAIPCALLGHQTRQGLSQPRDLFSTAELLERVVAFLISNTPADLVLDTTVGGNGFRRLPPLPGSPSNPNAPVVVDGSTPQSKCNSPSRRLSVQSSFSSTPRPSANPRLSQIKFGDLSPSKQNGHGSDAQRGPEALPKRQPTRADTIVSRVLLNLPFELLKHVLEHPALGKGAGELRGPARLKIISEIIAEREARRLRTFDKTNAHLRALQETLEHASGPLALLRPDDILVNNMGFREEVFQGDVPYLVNTWTQGSAESISS